MRKEHALYSSALLDPCPSTISRETQRNNGKQAYRHQQVQQISEARQQQRSRYSVLTDEVKAQAQASLKQSWSPEQIAGRWSSEGSCCISFVTLYRWIRKNQKAGDDLHRFLRNQKRRYAHSYGRFYFFFSIPSATLSPNQNAMQANNTPISAFLMS